MSLSDALKSETRRRPSTRCGLCTLLERLDESDSSALQEALANPLVHGSMISRALEREGHHVPAYTVTRHRRGDCTP